MWMIRIEVHNLRKGHVRANRKPCTFKHHVNVDRWHCIQLMTLLGECQLDANTLVFGGFLKNMGTPKSSIGLLDFPLHINQKKCGNPILGNLRMLVVSQWCFMMFFWVSCNKCDSRGPWSFGEFYSNTLMFCHIWFGFVQTYMPTRSHCYFKGQNNESFVGFLLITPCMDQWNCWFC